MAITTFCDNQFHEINCIVWRCTLSILNLLHIHFLPKPDKFHNLSSEGRHTNPLIKLMALFYTFFSSAPFFFFFSFFEEKKLELFSKCAHNINLPKPVVFSICFQINPSTELAFFTAIEPSWCCIACPQSPNLFLVIASSDLSEFAGVEIWFYWFY